MRGILVAVGIYLVFAVAVASARERSVIRDFRKVNACPSTELYTGPCPGWVVDHAVPLCLGGADAMHNLRWQEKAESYRKDVDERALCRWIILPAPAK